MESYHCDCCGEKMTEEEIKFVRERRKRLKEKWEKIMKDTEDKIKKRKSK